MGKSKRLRAEDCVETGDLFSRSTNGDSSSELVSFRLARECYDELAERAALHKLGASLYARAIVLEALSCNEVFGRMEFAINALQDQTHELRRDIAFFMQTLLMTAGKMSEKEAVEWVRRNFKA